MPNKTKKNNNTKNSKISKLNEKSKMLATMAKNYRDNSLIPILAKTSQQPNVKTKPEYAKVNLSKCAMKFALACSEPFHPSAKGVCGVFGFSAGETYKLSCITRFTMSAGTQGDGFVAITPTLGSDQALAYYTTSTYAGVDQVNILTANNTLAVGVSRQLAAQLPFNTSNLLPTSNVSNNNYVQGRIVAIGVRISYVGTTMNQSGNITCLAPTQHYNCTVSSAGTNILLSTLQGDEQAVISPVDRDWCDIGIFPTYPFEMGYSASGAISTNTSVCFPYANGATNISGFTDVVASCSTGSPIAILYINGTAAGNTFQVEIIQHVEYAGNNIGYATTPGESDEQGGRLVLRAAQQMETTKKSTSKRGWSLMYDLLKQGSHALIEHAVPAAVNAVVAMIT